MQNDSQKFGHKKAMSFKGLLTNLAKSHTEQEKSSTFETVKIQDQDENQTTGFGELGLLKLAAVEKILGGSMPTFDAKADHKKVTADAKRKAKKLFGDAKFAKQKEKENQGGKNEGWVKKKTLSLSQMMLKAAHEEDAKEKRRKERQDKIDAAAAEREKKRKKRVVNTNDRLLEDKVFTRIYYVLNHNM